MEIAVQNIQGKETGTKITLSDEIFGIEPSTHAIYQDIRLIMANARQGTHKAKERGEVKGSTKKPFRQKGTGGARAGHKRSPLMRHGGRVFGPRPRSYSFKLNHKFRQLARKSALSIKAAENNILVIDQMNFEAPRTKEFIGVLNNLNLGDKKVLVLLPAENRNVWLSGRNIPKTNIMLASDLNTYDVVNADTIVLLSDSVGVIHNTLGAN
jgi:large subunit ribosomal protein L4